MKILTAKALTAEWINVTPKMAKDWLENHNPINRRIRPALVQKYARDKTQDKWLTTHQGAAFDWNGHLVDGQHSLASIIESKVTTLMLVVRGLDPKVRMVVDTGAARKPADVLKLMGWPSAHNTDVAVVRLLIKCGNARRATMTEIVKAYEVYHDAVKAALEMFPTKRRHITIAPVYAPITRAWYTQDRDALQRFATILYGGMADGTRKGEASVIMLRDFLLESQFVTGDAVVKNIYAHVETALSAYLDDRKLIKLEPAKVELFPIPEKLIKLAKG